MGINWTKLKNNEQGKAFEALAIDYLKDNFKGDWEHTQQTRDGNKDAFTIVFLDKESWAEAKYTSYPRISRYRLDATIVSAIIHKNKVVEIIFITNSEISDGTKNDIQRALSNAMGDTFQVVHFRTKLDIEFWLYNNPEKYEYYFSDNRESLSNIKFTNIIVTSEVTFYNLIRQSIHFREPLRELLVGESYILTFSLFCPKNNVKYPFEINTDLIKVKQNFIDLSKGQNHISIEGICINKGDIPHELFTISTTKVKIFGKVTIKEPSINLKIDSQEQIAKVISESLEYFIVNDNSVIHAIKGRGGIGKSKLIEDLLKSDQFRGLDIIYQCFSIDNLDSSILLINIILSILFYHSDYSLIDVEYLRKLDKTTFVSSYLIDLVKSKSNFEDEKNEDSIKEFNKKISEYTNTKEIFPNFIELNKKVIILDDLHKLDDSSKTFLLNLISDLNSSNIKCFIILCGRNSFWDSNEYRKFLEKNNVKNHEYYFTNDDLYNNIRINGFDVDKKILAMLADRISIDIFFTSSLINFLKGKEEFFKGSSLESRHVVINSFIAEDNHKTSMLMLFRDITEQQMDILRIIYFSLPGVQKELVKKTYKQDIEKLESLRLIKYNNDKKLVPFHDLYQDVFKMHYQPPTVESTKKYITYTPQKYEEYRNYLSFFNDESITDIDLLQDIETLIENQKFYTILYILEPAFAYYLHEGENSKENNKNRFGENLYYKLQFYYAYSVTNCDKNIGGKEEFYRLYAEIKDIINPEIKKILIKTLAELINSSFEHLSLNEIDNYSNELKHAIKILETEGYIEPYQGKKDPSHLLMQEINVLKCLMLDDLQKAQTKHMELSKLCAEIGDFNKLEIINIRYARSLYHIDIQKAYNIIDESVKRLIEVNSTEKKWILLGEFEKCFIKIQIGGNGSLKDINNVHQKLKENFFNDYKKCSLAIAACYLVLGMKDHAYSFLYEDYFIKRKIRPRFLGLRLHLLAIYEYLFNKNTKSAIDYLLEQKNIFNSVGNSYKKIIEHNLMVISHAHPPITKVQFFNDKELYNNSLYIDPRIW